MKLNFNELKLTVAIETVQDIHVTTKRSNSLMQKCARKTCYFN